MKYHKSQVRLQQTTPKKIPIPGVFAPLVSVGLQMETICSMLALHVTWQYFEG